MIVGMLFLLLIPLRDAYAEGKLIEDPVLEEAIKQQLKFETDEELTEEHLLELTSLYPRGEGKIRSLKGLEYATNLEALYAPDQEIKDLSPLEHLTGITRLGLYSNQIENICPLANLYQLQQLVIFNNKIKSIDCLSQNYKITDLLIGDNEIQDITALVHLPLRWVSLEKNRITDIDPLKEHPTLETIFLNKNKVQDIHPLLSIPKLKTLYIKDNPLWDEGKPVIDELIKKGISINEMPSMSTVPNEITVILDGKKVNFNDAPYVEDGSTLVQFRPLFEALGLQIEWDERNQVVTGKKQDLQITLKVNDLTVVVNGVQQTLPSAPKVVNGNTFVPVRFISEALHYEVSWEEETMTISIYSDLQEFKSRDNTWSFKASHKWMHMDTGLSVDVSAISNEGKGFIFLEDHVAPEHIIDLTEYLNAYLSKTNYKPLSKAERFSANGLDAVYGSFSYESGPYQFGAKMIIIKGEKSLYKFLLTSNAKDFDESSTELLDIAKTFREIPTLEEQVAEKFKGKSAAERIHETFAYYKEMGFFQSMNVSEVEKTFLDNYPMDFAADKEFDPYQDNTYYQLFADQFILQLDKSRVWMEDTEADVGKGNDVYVKVLKQWAQISRGAFNPTDIVETWNTEEGPVKLQFILNGDKVILYPQYMNDFIDVGILKKINTKIAGSGYQFAVVAIDQQVFVTALNEKELAKISNERLWPLEQ